MKLTHIILVAQNGSIFPIEPRCFITFFKVEPHSRQRYVSDSVVAQGGNKYPPDSGRDGSGGNDGEVREGDLYVSEALPFTASSLADTQRPGLPLVWGRQSMWRRRQRRQGHLRSHFTWRRQYMEDAAPGKKDHYTTRHTAL